MAEDNNNLTSSFDKDKECYASLRAFTKKCVQEYPSISPEELADVVQRGMTKVIEEVFDYKYKPRPLEAKPANKKPIRAYLDGCFDIMHSGHYNAIRQAKALVDVLVVGVHSDEEILKHKGPPVMNDDERLAVVRACKWADEVVFGTPYEPSIQLLDQLKCDYAVHGDDMPLTGDGRDCYAEIKKSGRMLIVKRTEGVSTTDLVGRLLLMTRDHLPPASPSLEPQQPSEINFLSLVSGKEEGKADSKAEGASAAASASSTAKNHDDDAHHAKRPKTQTLEAGEEKKHYSAGISNFLPTTWRINQFSNHRKPGPDDVIVYVDGAFDLFHIGHIETLQQAKKLGTFLYVGIHTDEVVNHHKGRNYPIMNLHERVLNVLSCKHVDEVVIGAPWVITPDLITSLNIHVVASGSNTKMDREVDQSTDDPYLEAKKRGIYKEIQTSHALTTEDVVSRIICNRLKYTKRNAVRSVRDINYFKTKTFVQEV